MRSLRLATLTAALVVLSATAASAHPSFNPNAVPIGEPVETILVVPHGCSTGDSVMPEEGQAVPTTRVDLQLLDGVTVEPREVDGWVAEDDGEAIVWTADGGATTEPIEFPIILTVSEGSAGDQLEMAAYQECENGSSYRWTAGSEDTPPVRLELTEGETGTVDTGDDGHDMDMGTESEMDMGATESEMEMTEAPSEEASDLDAEAAADEAEGGSSTGLVVGVVVALLAIAAAGLAVRRRSA